MNWLLDLLSNVLSALALGLFTRGNKNYQDKVEKLRSFLVQFERNFDKMIQIENDEELLKRAEGCLGKWKGVNTYFLDASLLPPIERLCEEINSIRSRFWFRALKKINSRLQYMRSQTIPQAGKKNPSKWRQLLTQVLIGVLIGLSVLSIWDYLVLPHFIKDQIISSLYKEFRDNKSIWEENYKIITEDKGTLEQNKREEFLAKNLPSLPLRPLSLFSFKAWEKAAVDRSDLLIKILGNDRNIFNQYYDALRKIQDYVVLRENNLNTLRSKDTLSEENLFRFERLNQNVISLMEQNQDALGNVKLYFKKSRNPTLKDLESMPKISHVVTADTSDTYLKVKIR